MSCSPKPRKRGKQGESFRQVGEAQDQCPNHIISQLRPNSDSANSITHVWGRGNSDLVPTSSEGGGQMRLPAPQQKQAAPARPMYMKRGKSGSFSFKKVCVLTSGQSSARAGPRRWGHGSVQAELQGNPPPATAFAGGCLPPLLQVPTAAEGTSV